MKYNQEILRMIKKYNAVEYFDQVGKCYRFENGNMCILDAYNDKKSEIVAIYGRLKSRFGIKFNFLTWKKDFNLSDLEKYLEKIATNTDDIKTDINFRSAK